MRRHDRDGSGIGWRTGRRWPLDNLEMQMRLLSVRLPLILAGLAFTLGVQAQNLSIATGGTGGVYYPMGGGMAAVLSKHVRACRRLPRSPAARSTT